VTLLARCEVLARAAWYSRPPALPDTHAEHARSHAACASPLARSQSPADPVSRGTLPTAPAPTPRSCERLRFFHGRTAARRQMGKWATLELELACAASLRAPPLLLARALATVASPGEDQTGSTLSWCRSHAYVAALAAWCTGAASTHRRWRELEQGGSAGLFMTLLAVERCGAWVCLLQRRLYVSAATVHTYTRTATIYNTTYQHIHSHSCSSPAAGRRRLHLRQRNNHLAPPPCNRPAQLSLVVYIDRSMLCIERWDGQRGRCCYASSALSRGLEPVCRRHCRYSIVHLASRSRPLVRRWQILTAKWYVFVLMSLAVCARLVVGHTIDHARRYCDSARSPGTLRLEHGRATSRLDHDKKQRFSETSQLQSILVVLERSRPG